jgi:MFS family permease
MSQVHPPEPAELISAGRLAGFRRAYFTMTATDALGSGLFKTVSIFFWVRYAHFSVAIVGLGFTLGGISAMLLMLPAGRLGDRFGRRRTAIVINVVAAAAVAVFPLIHQIALFFAAMCLASASEASLEPLRRAYIGAQLPAQARQPFNARNRAVYNGGFGLGAALAGVGLVLGDTRTLAYLVIADAVSFLLAALAMSRLPHDRRTEPDHPDAARRDQGGGHVGTLGALAHPRVFASGAVIGLLALPDEALDIGLPVWIATTHRAPVWLVGGALILNTAFVVAFQVPLARWLQRMSMKRTCYLSSAFLAAAFVLLATTGSLDRAAATATAVCSVLALSCAEICGSVVDWEVSYSHARPGHESEFQAAFSLGTSSHQFVGGVLFADSIAAYGSLGWLVACVAPVLVSFINIYHRTSDLTG